MTTCQRINSGEKNHEWIGYEYSILLISYAVSLSFNNIH